MAYRTNAIDKEQRCKELLAEIEVLERRAREYNDLVRQRQLAARELEVLTNGRYVASNGGQPSLKAVLCEAANRVFTVGLVILTVLMVLAVGVKMVGPHIQRSGQPGMTGLVSEQPDNSKIVPVNSQGLPACY